VIKRLALIFLLFASVSWAQVSVAPIPYPRVQFLSSTGAPLAGGWVHTYVAGGMIPQATYTDYTGLVANANPVHLDAGGFADIWLGPFTYNIVVENSAGVLQWSVDGLKSPTGTLTVAGLTVTGNLAVGGTLSVTGAATLGCVARLNNICYAHCFAGANAGAKIAAAIAALPATGGTIDARGLEGAQTVNQNIFAGVTKPVKLLLGAATISDSVGQTITSLVNIEGLGDATVWNVTGATNGFTFGAGSDKSIIRNLRLTGAVNSIHGVAVTDAAGVSNGRIENVNVLNFKAGAGFYLGRGAISWTVSYPYSQGNRYGYKVESIGAPFNSNNHHFIHPMAINNANAADQGTQFQLIDCNGIQMDSPLSEVTNAVATVEGFDIRGCMSVTVNEPYIEHANTGKAIRIGANGTTPSQDIRFNGGTWQTGPGAPAFNVSLEGDRRTQILLPSVGLEDSIWNSSVTDLALTLTLSALTYDPVVLSRAPWKIRVIDSGSINPMVSDYQDGRNGGLYETRLQTNSIFQSEDFTHGSWTPQSANVTTVANSVVAPDGTTTADSIVLAAVPMEHLTALNVVTPGANTGVCGSVWVRAAAARRSAIEIIEAAVGTIAHATISVSTVWRRFSVCGTTSTANFVHFRIFPAYVDNGPATIYAWGAQLELGGLSDYIRTSSGPVTRPRGFSASKDAYFGGGVAAKRFKSINGTPLAAGDFAVHANWGDTPAAHIGAVVGTDQATTFEVHAGTANFGANPTVILTFKDLTWTDNPPCTVSRGDATAPTTGFATVKTTATAATMTFQGTPAAGTYEFTIICMGR